MSEEIRENTLKLKQIIIDEGLYEAGMSLDDMKELYKTLNRSKQTAKDEKDYRLLMSQTDINCTNLKELETNSTNEKIDESNIVEATAEDNEENLLNENNNDKPSIHNKPDFVFNFTVANQYKPPVMPTEHNKNLFPIIYHNPEVLKLPAEQKTEIINLFLQHEQKKIEYNQTKFIDQWGKEINYVPKTVVEDNEDINLDTNLEIETSKDSESEKQENDVITLRSSRLVKRKNYEEHEDSDDDFELVSNKKSKSDTVNSNAVNKDVKINDSSQNTSAKSQKRESDEEILSPTLHKKSKLSNTFDNLIINKSTPLPKASEIQSISNKWYNKTNTDVCKKFFPPEVSDRTNKLFDKLKDEEKNKPKDYSLKLNDVADLSDSSDDIFPASKNNDIHNEVTPKAKKGKTTIKKKSQTKTRKKLNLKHTEEQSEINVSEISVPNFYGKNKENEINISINNETSPSNMIQCPICSKSFPNLEIEVHASRCEQYDDDEELCLICNQYFSSFEIDEHKRECIRKITQVSTEKPRNKSKQEFLCEVCNKMISNTDPLEHAGNCIAVVKK